MENLGYLFAGYAVVWVLLFAYMFSISRRQSQLEKEIAMLKEMRSGAELE